MLSLLKNWKGAIEIDGTKYDSVQDAINLVNNDNFNSNIIMLHSIQNNAVNREITQIESKSVQTTATPVQTTATEEFIVGNTYCVTVKPYMTKKASSTFDFMLKWNNNTPMPLRTMVGTVESETKGMVYMKLRGELIAEQVQTCMKCGRQITNKISQFFGMGPECGGHSYINPFDSDEELKLAVSKYTTEYLHNISWEGWIIKSAIIKKENYYENNTGN